MKNFGAPVSRERTQINITSLIDVIFVLVIFFMISASFEKPAIPIALPQASSGETVPKQSLLVSVDAQRRIYLEGTETPAEALRGGLAQHQGADRGVSLECDASLPFQAVLEVMDLIKNAGVSHVAIRHALSR